MKITCPNCDHTFELDLTEDMASSIRDQVRNEEFEKEVESRLSALKKSNESEMKAKVAEAILSEREKYEDKLKKANTESSKKDAEIETLKAKLESDIRSKTLEKELELKEKFDKDIAKIESEKKDLETELDYYKNLKVKMSTKAIGESLEQYCENEFNKVRMMAFPRAEFGKDNVVSKESGSKGDFIFREYDEDGVEIVSIMFEMKNEMETTEKKHKNENFFKELDKDRKEKKCEYAVLVSLLESESDLYNQGIVDVSYAYPKMFVIRPQFFIPIISLLRNAALASLDSKKELIKIQNQNLDVSNFKDNFEEFKKAFGYNYVQAHKRLGEAVAEIDKAIARLQAVKDALTASDKQISQANKKADEITIEKLCKNAPMMLEKFNSIGKE
ncbi:MAG: DUF2130 domain-containing protein [Lachnospiraceae bacterium]|nr:DUF2130 domain-containing protein [Lachnospiraceae bacterium]